jgi:hypothetical protein
MIHASNETLILVDVFFKSYCSLVVLAKSVSVRYERNLQRKQTFGSLVAQPQRAKAIVSLGHSDNGDAIRARSLSSSLAIAST